MTPYAPTLGLDYAVFERTTMFSCSWSSWELLAVFLNERDAEKMCLEPKASFSQRQVFVTKGCYENWQTQEKQATNEALRNLFKGWIEKYKDAHVMGVLSRYQLPDL